MRIELEYNARSIPPADVARSFVPPTPHFARLLSRNHTLLLGPRGSGKTTLLKMLTARALENWKHPLAKALASQVTFNAAFIPADVTWGTQIDAFEQLNFHPRRKEAAFVLHTLRAMVHSMREATEMARRTVEDHISHLVISMSAEQEQQFVKLVSSNLNVVPQLNSLLGLEVALKSRLDAINSSDEDQSFTVNSLPSKISLLISAFNGVTGDGSRRWALLFDELEIAPTRVKTFLLSGIRSFDEQVIVKLALAPYMELGSNAIQHHLNLCTTFTQFSSHIRIRMMQSALVLSSFRRHSSASALMRGRWILCLSFRKEAGSLVDTPIPKRKGRDLQRSFGC